jgi:hypothetical protein
MGVPCSGRRLEIVSHVRAGTWRVRDAHTGRGLLLAEALHALSSHVGRLVGFRAVGEGGGRRYRRWRRKVNDCSCKGEYSNVRLRAKSA